MSWQLCRFHLPAKEELRTRSLDFLALTAGSCVKSLTRFFLPKKENLRTRDLDFIAIPSFTEINISRFHLPAKDELRTRDLDFIAVSLDCEGEVRDPCYNLGGIPVRVLVTSDSEDDEGNPKVIIDLSENPLARSRQFQIQNDPDFGYNYDSDKILTGEHIPLNVRNITQVIYDDDARENVASLREYIADLEEQIELANDIHDSGTRALLEDQIMRKEQEILSIQNNADFIDTDWYPIKGFDIGGILVPYGWVQLDTTTLEYRYDTLVNDWRLPTFDPKYSCQRYPSAVRATYWDITSLYEEPVLEAKRTIEVKLFCIDNTDNRRFTYDKSSGIPLEDVHKKAIAGKYAIEISITEEKESTSTEPFKLTWTSNKALDLTVDHRNPILNDTPDGDNKSAVDSWTITENNITANLKYFRFRDSNDQFYTNSGHNQDEAIPWYHEDDFEVVGEYNVSIDIDRRDIYTTLDRRFYINLIYDNSRNPENMPEIRVEVPLEQEGDPDDSAHEYGDTPDFKNIDGFTHHNKYFKNTAEDVEDNWDFKLDTYSFLEQPFEYHDLDLTDFPIPYHPESVRVYGIEVVANLNWLRKLQTNVTFNLRAEGAQDEVWADTFRVIISSQQINSVGDYLGAVQEDTNDIIQTKINQIYVDETFHLPKYERFSDLPRGFTSTPIIAQIKWNRDAIYMVPNFE